MWWGLFLWENSLFYTLSCCSLSDQGQCEIWPNLGRVEELRLKRMMTLEMKSLL